MNKFGKWIRLRTASARQAAWHGRNDAGLKARHVTARPEGPGTGPANITSPVRAPQTVIQSNGSPSTLVHLGTQDDMRGVNPILFLARFVPPLQGGWKLCVNLSLGLQPRLSHYGLSALLAFSPTESFRPKGGEERSSRTVMELVVTHFNALLTDINACATKSNGLCNARFSKINVH